ncbi:hypothetical protein [Micromonospora sp. RTGN7]|uniref:hypothetical protein n=1 Tax=Micromonospora sp. RTGN7 TaxID=3016526 RepID=UPI0029FF386E|nr:hypothetical protein [Micromonospora sp. RTGN7]
MVGWAANAVMVDVATDLVRIDVQIEVFDEAPAVDDSADLLRDGQLEVPGGLISVLYSVDELFQRGVDLPAGPGTYGVRVCGYGRIGARQLREEGENPGGRADTDAIVEALAGVERYRICLWQVSAEPRWEYDDEDESPGRAHPPAG